MKPFDVHTHLQSEQFDSDRDKVILKCKKLLSGVITLGEDIVSNRQVIELANRYSGFLHAGLALQPTVVHKLTQKQIDSEIKFISQQKNLICIGETGIDYKIVETQLNSDSAAKKHQISVFQKCIALARDMDLPLNVHCRWATKPLFDTLKGMRAEQVLLHSFEGTVSEARHAISLGYKLSVGNTLTSRQVKQDIVRNLPLEAFMLETDSPECASQRGVRNEPANILEVMREIAEIKQVSQEDVIKTTNKNVRELFRI